MEKLYEKILRMRIWCVGSEGNVQGFILVDTAIIGDVSAKLLSIGSAVVFFVLDWPEKLLYGTLAPSDDRRGEYHDSR